MTPLTPTDPITRLADALEGFAVALATGRPDVVLSAEAPLGAAVTALRVAQPEAVIVEPGVRAALVRVRLAVDRCRTMGLASGQLLAAVAAGDLVTSGYGPSGRRLGANRLPATVAARS